MNSRTSRGLIVAAVLGVVAAGGSAVAFAAAAASKAPAHAKIVVKGGESFKPNAYVKNTMRFVPDTITVRSGGTVTVATTTSEPHTLSLVKRSDLPRSVAQVDSCEMAAARSVCNALAQAHGVDPTGPPPQGPPPKPLVDVGNPGFDQPGDSTFIPPKGAGGPVSFKVTAKPGTTLYYLCAIHPWMIGRISVK
jgi:plastocyanin